MTTDITHANIQIAHQTTWAGAAQILRELGWASTRLGQWELKSDPQIEAELGATEDGTLSLHRVGDLGARKQQLQRVAVDTDGLTSCCSALTTYTGDGAHVCKSCFYPIPLF